MPTYISDPFQLAQAMVWPGVTSHQVNGQTLYWAITPSSAQTMCRVFESVKPADESEKPDAV